MQVLIVGHGSIGARHARLVQELGGIVSVVSRREIDLSETQIARRFATLPEALNAQNFDYIIIANRTNEHYETLKVLTEHNFAGRVLVEKPLFDKLQTPPIAASTLSRIFVAYNLRFSPLLLRVRELLRGQKLVSAQARVGQWLPSWRPDSDYRDCYSARKNEGGGALRDLSHELDYLNWLLGGWTRVAALGGKFSALKIDSDDVFALLLETRNCPVVSLEVNYLDRVTRRELIINTQQMTIRADFMAGEIQVNEQTEKFVSKRDETYRVQHRAILQPENKTDFAEVLCSLEEGLDVLRLIEAVEMAATQERWVRREEVSEI